MLNLLEPKADLHGQTLVLTNKKMYVIINVH